MKTYIINRAINHMKKWIALDKKDNPTELNLRQGLSVGIDRGRQADKLIEDLTILKDNKIIAPEFFKKVYETMWKSSNPGKYMSSFMKNLEKIK